MRQTGGTALGEIFHQVESAFAGNFQGFKRGKNAELLAIFVNDANFTRAYPIVDADKLFRRTLIDVPPPSTRGYASPREYNISPRPASVTHKPDQRI